MAAKLTAVILLVSTLVLMCATTRAGTRRVWPEESCESEVEEQMPMEQCDKWARSGWPEIRLLSGEEEEERNEECCQELRQVSDECRCYAVSLLMSEMPDIWARRMACSLPSRCDLNSCACPR